MRRWAKERDNRTATTVGDFFDLPKEMPKRSASEFVVTFPVVNDTR